MGISKVEYNNKTLIDISNDSVTKETLAYGETAHDSNGELVVGEMVPPTNADTVGGWHFAVRNDGTPPEEVTVPTLTLVYTEGG